MEINDLINDLKVWKDQIHPHFKSKKFIDFISKYIEKASSDTLSEEYDCLSKQESFYHAVYFLRRMYSGFIHDERVLDHYYGGILIPHNLRPELEKNYDEKWTEYENKIRRRRITSLRGKFR